MPTFALTTLGLFAPALIAPRIVPFGAKTSMRVVAVLDGMSSLTAKSCGAAGGFGTRVSSYFHHLFGRELMPREFRAARIALDNRVISQCWIGYINRFINKNAGFRRIAGV